MIAYCGLECTECGAYIAKRTGDDALRIKTAKMWSEPGWPVRPEEINCDGCKTEGGTQFKLCSDCKVRSCASERGFETCAHCEDYPCSTLQALLDLLGDVPKHNLIKISQSL